MPSGIASAARVVRACGTYSLTKKVRSLANAGTTLPPMACRACSCSCACSAAGMLAGSFLKGAYSGEAVVSFSSDTVAMDTSRPSSTARGTLKPRLRPARMFSVCWSK